MNIYYFDKKHTPHLSTLIRELGLVDGLPYTLDENSKFDSVINQFFLDLVVPQSPSKNTWRTYAEQLSFFFRYLESQKKTWREVTIEDLKTYYRIRRIEEGSLKITARSWNVFAASLRRFYEWAVHHNHLEALPFQYKEILSGSPAAHYGQTVTTTELHDKPRRKDIKYITEQDFRERLLPAITNTREGIRNALFARLLMRSGLRANEAVKITLSALPDPDNPRYAGRKTCPVTITGKGNKQRTVRVPKSWLRDAQRYIQWDRADAIQRWKANHPRRNPAKEGDCGYLFLISDGTPVTYNTLYKMLRSAGEKSGFNFKSHPHMLRHSYAIYQLSQMIKEVLQHKEEETDAHSYRSLFRDPLRRLQLLMGHSNPATTFIYLDYLDEFDSMVDVTLDEELFGNEDGYENVSGRDINEEA